MLRYAPLKDVWAAGMSAFHVIPSGSEGSCFALASEKLEARSLAAARDEMKGSSFISVGGPKAHVTLSMTDTLFPQPARVSFFGPNPSGRTAC